MRWCRRGPSLRHRSRRGRPEEAHRREEPDRRPLLEGRSLPTQDQEPIDHVDTEAEQQRTDPRLGGVTVDADQEGRADEGADEARDREDPHGAPVDVAELSVRETGDQRGPDLGEVHRGRRSGGRETGSQQQGRGGHSIGHAQGAVDELGEEADEAQHEQFPHGGPIPVDIDKVDRSDRNCLNSKLVGLITPAVVHEMDADSPTIGDGSELQPPADHRPRRTADPQLTLGIAGDPYVAPPAQRGPLPHRVGGREDARAHQPHR